MRYWRELGKDWGISAVIVIAAFVIWQVVTRPRPQSSGPAPDFALVDLDGQEVRLSELGDGLIVLNFWFTDCGPCRHEIPELAAWHTANPEIPLIGVSTDRLPIEMLRTRSAQLGVNYTVVHDAYSEVSSDYGVGLCAGTGSALALGCAAAPPCAGAGALDLGFSGSPT